jgi:hypothetical protein
MNAIIEPDKQNRIVLTRDVREAAGFIPGEPLKLSVSPGRVVLEVRPKPGGRLVKRGKLLVWTGEVPPVPLDEAIRKARHHQR